MKTNYRLLEVSENVPVVFFVPKRSVQAHIVRSWFLTHLDTGFLARTRNSVWSSIQVQYGSIRIEPLPAVSVRFGLRRKDVARAIRFLMDFANFESELVFNVGNGVSASATAALQVDFPFTANERLAAKLDGNGVTHHAIKLFNWKPPSWLAKCLSCAYYPYRIQQELVVTSHRILAKSWAINDPCLCTSCLSLSYQTYFWSKLSSRYYLGTQTNGTVDVEESCAGRCLSTCGYNHGQTARSKFSLAYYFTSTHNGFAIEIESKQRHATSGLLEDQQLTDMRYGAYIT